MCKGSFEKGALENEDRSTKHPNLENEALKTRKRRPLNLENEAPKTRKRSTQKLDTGLSFINTRPMLIQQESSTITNRMQFKSTQVEMHFRRCVGDPVEDHVLDVIRKPRTLKLFLECYCIASKSQLNSQA